MIVLWGTVTRDVSQLGGKALDSERMNIGWNCSTGFKVSLE